MRPFRTGSRVGRFRPSTLYLPSPFQPPLARAYRGQRRAVVDTLSSLLLTSSLRLSVPLALLCCKHLDHPPNGSRHRYQPCSPGSTAIPSSE